MELFKPRPFKFFFSIKVKSSGKGKVYPFLNSLYSLYPNFLLYYYIYYYISVIYYISMDFL